MAEKHFMRSADILMIITCFLWGLGTVCKNAYGDTLESFRVMIFNGLIFPVAALLLFIPIKISGSNARIRLKHMLGMVLVFFFDIFVYCFISCRIVNDHCNKYRNNYCLYSSGYCSYFVFVRFLKAYKVDDIRNYYGFLWRCNNALYLSSIHKIRPSRSGIYIILSWFLQFF